MLASLPPEVLGFIVENASKADLKALSLVSKRMYAVVVRVLWRSIIIKPWAEHSLHRFSVAALPQTCLELATQLEFYSEIRYAIRSRCPHANPQRPREEDEEEDQFDTHKGEAANDDGDKSNFDRLTRKAKSLLGRLKDYQLNGFSWDLGTCLHSDILGSNGIVSLRQPFLRSLSLTTNPTCHYHAEHDDGIDLSSFKQLRRLRWRGPRIGHMGALRVAIRNNSAQLKELELDLVNWREFLDKLVDFNDEEKPDLFITDQFFVREILGLRINSPSPILSHIHVLCLSNVHITAAMARAINFETLKSLTLRICPGWDEFLDQVVKLNLQVKLRTLELQEISGISKRPPEWTVRDFLDTFQGLEELFFSHSLSDNAIEFWKNLIRHQGTLKRFIHHPRTNDNTESPSLGEEEVDSMGQAFSEHNMRYIKENPSQNPLWKLDLECIGLTCIPEHLKYILLPFASKTALKAVYIRQSNLDIRRCASWIFEDSSNRTRIASDIRNDSSSQNDYVAASNETWLGYQLRDEFSRFAEWIFGPHGVQSLQVVFFGDFTFGGRESKNMFCVFRGMNTIRPFRILPWYEPECKDAVKKYREILEACPTEPLLL